VRLWPWQAEQSRISEEKNKQKVAVLRHAASAVITDCCEQEWEVAAHYWDGREDEHAEFQQLEAEYAEQVAEWNKVRRRLCQTQHRALRRQDYNSTELEGADEHAELVYVRVKKLRDQIQELKAQRRHSIRRAAARPAVNELTVA